jgi:tetratricopeptide (TPR) repeat protein
MVAEARQAHRKHYLARAEEAEPHLIGPDQLIWLDRLDRDEANLRLAVESAIEDDDPDTRFRLVRALTWFWAYRGYVFEVLDLVERAVGQPVSSPPNQRRMEALVTASRMKAVAYDFRSATRLADEAIDQAIAIGSDAEAALAEASSLRALAYFGSSSQPLSERERESQELAMNTALALARRTGHPFLIARVLQERTFCRLSGLRTDDADHGPQLELARTDLGEAIELVTQIGDRFQLSHAIHDLGWLELVAADYERALGHLTEVWTIDTGNQDRVSLLDCSFNLGMCHLRRGAPEAAKTWFRNSLELSAEVGDVAGEAFAMLGLSSADSEDSYRAVRLLGASDAVLRSSDGQLQLLEANLRTSTSSRLRHELGGTAFDVAHREGSRLSREQALALARAATSQPEGTI